MAFAGGRGTPVKKPMQAFKKMDATNNPKASSQPANVTRSPSGIKDALLQWCKMNTTEYEQYGVNITNFSSSWNDGMAFCALIHHFYPKSFDFTRLNPKNRKGNFKLAFDAAEKLAGIAPLLEVEDMVRMKNPDWKCVFTYIQQFYRRFGVDKDKEEGGGQKGETQTTTTTVTTGPGGEETTTTTTVTETAEASMTISL